MLDKGSPAIRPAHYNGIKNTSFLNIKEAILIDNSSFSVEPLWSC